MSQEKRLGGQTLQYYNKPAIASWASIVGKKEGEGPLAHTFDQIEQDDTLGQESWEKAEARMLEMTVEMCLEKAGMHKKDVHVLLCGDLLNQITSASFAARQLDMPFLGVYGACSTMAESLVFGSMMVDGGYMGNAVCGTCSHFSTAERQYRTPLELGNQRTPTAQRTVTGAGATLLMAAPPPKHPGVNVTMATIGRVVDLGVTASDNMGAAMAPAASDTILHHLADTGRKPADYDLIVTGDLGYVGSELFLELCKRQGTVIDNHLDCGCEIFAQDQDVHAGASGCGCAATVLNGWLLGRLSQGKLKRILFVATGALHSPTTSMQGESIPGVAHGIVLEGSN